MYRWPARQGRCDGAIDIYLGGGIDTHDVRSGSVRFNRSKLYSKATDLLYTLARSIRGLFSAVALHPLKGVATADPKFVVQCTAWDGMALHGTAPCHYCGTARSAADEQVLSNTEASEQIPCAFWSVLNPLSLPLHLDMGTAPEDMLLLLNAPRLSSPRAIFF